MNTVKRWKIKEHYVAGEFAGYVVVTDDKYEDVVCHSIGVDYRDDAVLIASAPELKAECDQLREALKEVLPIINVINPRTINSLDLSKLSEKIFRVVKD